MTGNRSLGLALLLVLLVFGCAVEESGEAATHEAPGGGEAEDATPAPDFTLPDLAGQPVRLADHRGKTVIIDFWATWCPPCIFQVPELNKFWQAHKETGDVMVIGVAVDVEGAAVVKPWVEDQGVEYTIVIGDESLARDFGALGFPTLVIVTPEGNVDSLHVGLIEVKELEGIVAPLRGASST
jgi:thiol-disulfide isomerase/thioredoxin